MDCSWGSSVSGRYVSLQNTLMICWFHCALHRFRLPCARCSKQANNISEPPSGWCSCLSKLHFSLCEHEDDVTKNLLFLLFKVHFININLVVGSMVQHAVVILFRRSTCIYLENFLGSFRTIWTILGSLFLLQTCQRHVWHVNFLIVFVTLVTGTPSCLEMFLHHLFWSWFAVMFFLISVNSPTFFILHKLL